MDKLLRRAREGATVNALAGEGRPQYRGKGIISRLRLLGTCSGDTLEAKELKTLLKQNGDAAAGPGRPATRLRALVGHGIDGRQSRWRYSLPSARRACHLRK